MKLMLLPAGLVLCACHMTPSTLNPERELCYIEADSKYLGVALDCKTRKDFECSELEEAEEILRKEYEACP